MALTFPDSPSIDDTHTVGGGTWVYDGVMWSKVLPTDTSVQSDDVRHVVQLTQAAYDALTPNAETLYIIVG